MMSVRSLVGQLALKRQHAVALQGSRLRKEVLDALH